MQPQAPQPLQPPPVQIVPPWMISATFDLPGFRVVQNRGTVSYTHLDVYKRQHPALLPAGLLVGGLFAAEFLFVAEGLNRTTASHMSVFLYTAPIWAAVVLHFRIPEERLSGRQWIGIGVAFLGIVTAFIVPTLGEGSATLTREMLLGDLFALLAGAAWGLTTVAVRVSRLSEAPPTQTLFYQLAVSFVLLLALTLLTGQLHFTSTPIALSLIHI